MRAICLADSLTAEQLDEVGPTTGGRTPYSLTVGREYVVVAVWCHTGSMRGRGTLIDVATEYLRVVNAPICLFRISDAHLPSSWTINQLSQSSVMIGDPALLRRYFYDDLSNGNRQAIEEFEDIVARATSV